SLIVRWKDVLAAHTEVQAQVRLIDLYPTILDLLSINSVTKVSGISLKPWLLDPKKADPQLYSYCETYTPWLHFGWSRLLGVRAADNWKFIQAPKSELYDLSSDKGEIKNLF